MQTDHSGVRFLWYQIFFDFASYCLQMNVFKNMAPQLFGNIVVRFLIIYLLEQYFLKQL
jgi:hypothetical protein